MSIETAPSIVLEGTLAQDATVRTRPVGDQGAPMIVLCLQLKDVGEGNNTVTAEQVFPPHAHAAAHARAKQLPKGLRISITAPCAHMHLTLQSVQHINKLDIATATAEA